jgi:hypothetical protein
VDTLYFSVNNIGLFEVSSAAVPEPATWTLLIAGFGAAGAVLRRRAAVRSA